MYKTVPINYYSMTITILMKHCNKDLRKQLCRCKILNDSTEPLCVLKGNFCYKGSSRPDCKKKCINLESRKLVKLSLIQKDSQVSDVDFGMLLTYHIKTSENTEIS